MNFMELSELLRIIKNYLKLHGNYTVIIGNY